MDRKLQVGPDPGQVALRFGLQFGEPLEQQEQPARRAGNRADVTARTAPGQQADLAIPVRLQRQFCRRPGAQPDPNRRGHGSDARDVAGANAGRQRFQVGAAAQHETQAAPYPAARPGGEMVRHNVERRPLVGADHRLRDGDIFRDVPRRAAGEREPVDRARPADIGNLRKGAAPDVVAERIVVAHRDGGLKVGDRADASEAVLAAEPGLRRRAHQLQQFRLLDRCRVHRQQAPQAAARPQAQKGRRIDHRPDIGWGPAQP